MLPAFDPIPVLFFSSIAPKPFRVMLPKVPYRAAMGRAKAVVAVEIMFRTEVVSCVAVVVTDTVMLITKPAASRRATRRKRVNIIRCS